MTRSQFLNEAHIYFEDDLLDTLTNIENPIAKRLLDLHKQQQKTDIGFVTQAAKPGSVNIITYTKAAETLRKKKDDDFIEDVAKNVEADKPLDQHDRTKSFNFLRDNKAMTTAKISRLVNTLFPKEYEDAEGQKVLRDLIDKYGALTDDTTNFEVVKGEDIRKWYDEETYDSKKGELASSCMRHSRCQEYLDIYVKNPEVVSMLICTNAKGLLIGRALIWELTDSGASQLMDRIYFRDERIKEKFIAWAEEKDIAYKAGRGLTNTIWRGERLKRSPKVQLENWEFDYYPYMDTFQKLDMEDGMLYNSDDRAEGFYILNSTDGDYSELGTYWSNYEDQEINEEEAEWSEPLGDWISRENGVYRSTDYDRTTGFYPRDHHDVVLIDGEGYFHIDDTVYSACMDQQILYSDAIEIVGGIDDMEAKEFGHEHDYTDRSKKLVMWQEMLCADWLKRLIDLDIWDEKPFIIDDLRKVGEKYILRDHELTVYNTEKGQLSEEHCVALNIETEGLKEILTDEPSYYYNLDKSTKFELISALKDKDDKEVEKIENWVH